MKTVNKRKLIGVVLLFGAMSAHTAEQNNHPENISGEFSIFNSDYAQTQKIITKPRNVGAIGYELVEYLGSEKRIAIVQDSLAGPQFIFHDRKDAELARRMWKDSNYSLLEIYLAFEGNRQSAPKEFVKHHLQLHGKDADIRRTTISDFNTIEPGAADLGGLGPTDMCYHNGGLDGCNVYGNIRIGLISSPFGICDEDNGDDFNDWEHYLNSHLYNPFDGSPFPIGFSNLGDHGELGYGVESGGKHITIPSTRSGGILVCDRPDSSVYWFDMVIEEELFPNAWFVLHNDGHFPGMVYGIAFDGDFLHQSIRVRVKYPEEASSNAEFYWAATY
jgi:hypothetical protein